ncbi:MAG: alpha/beta hydrolase [Anaerolineales bacterium]
MTPGWSAPGTRLVLVAMSTCLLAACSPTPTGVRAADRGADSGQTWVEDDGTVEVGAGQLYFHQARPTNPSVTLLAVHGGPGMNSRYMASLDRLAGAGITVIRYDQRGSGRSTMPSGDMSLGAHVSDLFTVWQATGEEPAVLFGHSWGGLLSLAFSAAHPQAVAGLVLFGSAPPTRADLQLASGSFERRLVMGQRAGWIDPQLPEELTSLAPILPAYFADPGFEASQELSSAALEPAINVGTWNALGDYDLRPQLAGFEGPVLFFYGEADPFGQAMGQSVLQALTSTEPEVHWLKDCGHFWQECPQDVLPLLERFLLVQ